MLKNSPKMLRPVYSRVKEPLRENTKFILHRGHRREDAYLRENTKTLG